MSDAESELEDVVDEEDEVLSGHEENGLESADSVRGLLDLANNFLVRSLKTPIFCLRRPYRSQGCS